MDNNQQLLYEAQGFSLLSPNLDRSTFHAWNAVDTIIFQPFVIPRPGTYWKQRYIIFLSKPPETLLETNASWFNRMAFKLLGSSDRKTVYLYNTLSGFEAFLPAAAQALAFSPPQQDDFSAGPKVQDIFSKRTTDAQGSAINLQVTAAERNIEYQVVFDRRNRGFEEIYSEHGGM